MDNVKVQELMEESNRLQMELTDLGEQMNQRESETLTPQDLVNSRIVTNVLNLDFEYQNLSRRVQSSPV